MDLFTTGPSHFLHSVQQAHLLQLFMSWVSLRRYMAQALGAITTFHQSIKIHLPQPSQQLHSPPSCITHAIVNLSPPWEKMSGVVLKLINAPINDLSGFASKLSFTLFLSFVLFLSIFPAKCRISFTFTCELYADVLFLCCRHSHLFCGRQVHGLNAMSVSAIATNTAAMEEEWRT